jgi:hypothetical protein
VRYRKFKKHATRQKKWVSNQDLPASQILITTLMSFECTW